MKWWPCNRRRDDAMTEDDTPGATSLDEARAERAESEVRLASARRDRFADEMRTTFREHRT